jgi:hypothetical protein
MRQALFCILVEVLVLLPMTKPRPGVAAAIRLAANHDTDLWKRVEDQFRGIRSDALEQAEKSLLASIGDDDDDLEELSKNQLLDLVKWKFAVGKPRPQNLGLLRCNTEDAVKECSRNAVQLARNIDMQASVSKTGEWTTHGKSAIQNAMNEMTKLKGVGPATATAVLCRVRPDVFCYLYDEVIDCFEPKRDYTLNVYLRVNSRCLQLAKTLGEEEWTTARIATVLWIAARVLANKKDDDLTVSLAQETLKPSKKNLQEEEEEQGNAKQPSRKRRRTNNR